HVRGRGPRDRRRDHLVARADSDGDESQVERSRSGGDRERVLRLDVLREAPLELGRPRPGRQPARAQRLCDRIDLLVADRWWLEREERLTPFRGELLHGRSVLAPPTGQTSGDDEHVDVHAVACPSGGEVTEVAKRRVAELLVLEQRGGRGREEDLSRLGAGVDSLTQAAEGGGDRVTGRRRLPPVCSPRSRSPSPSARSSSTMP